MRRSCGRLRVVWIVPVSGPYPARISPYQPVSARIRMRAVGKRWARETLQWRRTQLPGRAITVDNKQFSSLPLSRTAGRCPGAARARVPESGACAPGDRRQLEKRGTNMKRSEEHTSELQSLMRISYAVFCLKKKKKNKKKH